MVKQDELPKIGLSTDFNSHAIVISHDCDIPHPKEEIIEIISAKVVTPNKQLMNCKNPRTLHLCIKGEGDVDIFLELNFKSRLILPKADFSKNLSGPCEKHSITEQDKRTLKQWLSARFGRPAYPNSFENRLQKRVKKDSVEKLIAKLVEPLSAHITGLFIGLDGDKNRELPEGEPYCLSIYVVYNAEGDIATSRRECEELAHQISKLLISVYGEPHEATEICLERCNAIAETHITLADLMKVDQWRLEWISLSEGDEKYLPIG